MKLLPTLVVLAFDSNNNPVVAWHGTDNMSGVHATDNARSDRLPDTRQAFLIDIDGKIRHFREFDGPAANQTPDLPGMPGAPASTDPAAPALRKQLEDLGKPDLVDLAIALGLPAKGTKAELVEALLAVDPVALTAVLAPDPDPTNQPDPSNQSNQPNPSNQPDPSGNTTATATGNTTA